MDYLVGRRKRLEQLRAQLDLERSSFLPHWRELGDYFLPRRPRLTTNEVNRGTKMNHKIIDGTGAMSVRTLRAGMMSGVTSPARPWFRLTTPVPGMAEQGAAKWWLNEVANQMSTMFLRSNLYNVLPIIYGDIGVFATAAMLVEEDQESGIRCYPFPIGSYMVSVNDKLKVDTFIRDFKMTVRQLISKFGVDQPGGEIQWDRFSQQVKDLWNSGEREQWIEVCHVIEPNTQYDPNSPLAKHKRYSSVYYERGTSARDGTQGVADLESNKYLRESGYDYFPVLCPRWEVTGEDSYGTECPGMLSLGDNKQLQLGEKRSMQAIEKQVNPPLTGPTTYKSIKTSTLPGDITYADEPDGTRGLRPIHEVRADISALEAKQEQVRQRIRRAFFEDLFLMLANSDRRHITAREIEERHEEKLLALGPVLEQLNQDLLDPLIDIAFDIGMKQGLFPPPPPELEGIDLKVEYISIMAQAQKLVGLAGIERFMGFVGQVAQFDPNALDKVDVQQSIDVYADITSVDPSIVRSDEDAAEISAQRAEAQAAQQRNEAMLNATQSARNLSGAKLGDDNALNRILSQANAGSLIPEEEEI